ncbi:unnamed protein product [Cuscuta europaea]|uniref:MATH domain-containing protein n=1 Tax=Cuscuta europaea TaxID=41803 RepID=A0A9P0YTR8_CUSEU|nr:unnamed protein product [Cuscuta europaea]
MDYQKSKFTWRIENFSQLDAKMIYSMTFVVNEYEWKLCVFPKGIQTDHLSMFLVLANQGSLPDGLNIKTEFSLALINQKDSNQTIKKDKVPGKFITLNKFYDQSEGYLVDDTCLVEAELSILPDASSDSYDNGLDSSAIVDDPSESVYVEAQLFLESIPKKPCNGCSESKAPTCEMALLEGHTSSVIETLDMLISYPFDALANPRYETKILESLSALSDHLYMFSDARAKEIMNLKTTFPQIIEEWRDSVQGQGRSKHPWSCFEKTLNLLEDLGRRRNQINAKLQELNIKEMELKNKLEVIESSIQQLMEEREELSKQTKAVCSLAEEQVSNIEGEEVELVGNLDCKSKLKWSATRVLFC